MSKDTEKESFVQDLVFLLVLAVVVLVWIYSPWKIDPFFGGIAEPSLSDKFAPVNALFSGLAFACFAYAVYLQRKELRLQREELRLQRQEAEATREEIRGQKEQAIAQNATLVQQVFDNTFFELIRNHADIVRSIDLRDSGKAVTSQGRDCFKVFYNRFATRWKQVRTEDQLTTELDRISRTYRHFYKSYESDLGHYFRSLLNLISYVDESQTANKRLYTNLIRVQISKYESLLLFYNCLSEVSSPKFKGLVEKYALLKSLPRDYLLDRQNHIGLYSESAY